MRKVKNYLVDSLNKKFNNKPVKLIIIHLIYNVSKVLCFSARTDIIQIKKLGCYNPLFLREQQ